jgi:hypothetical protein
MNNNTAHSTSTASSEKEDDSEMNKDTSEKNFQQKRNGLWVLLI